jgi:RNAse (barnase) inhibitor barstar
MAVFKNDPSEWNNLDWTILRNGSISLYWRQEYLNSDIEWFLNEKYTLVRFDCSTWVNTSKMHQDLHDQLKFPEYYGGSFNALNDCLEDIEIEGTGLITVFEHSDLLQKDTRQALLDVFDRASRFHMLMGNRLINLIQIDNPDTEFEPVNACPVIWNNREWMAADRRSPQ